EGGGRELGDLGASATHLARNAPAAEVQSLIEAMRAQSEHSASLLAFYAAITSGSLAIRNADYFVARDEGTRALEIGTANRDEGMIQRASMLRGTALLRMSQFEEAKQCFEGALVSARRLEDPIRQGSALNNLSLIELHHGNLRAAARLSTTA